MVNHTIKKNIEYIDSAGISLALHSWLPCTSKAILFYFHGLQSHAGWLNEFGERLAQSAIAVFVLDRRGAGLSAGLRGDIYCKEVLLHDYDKCLSSVTKRYPHLPITLFGHCLGGSILAALMCWPKMCINVNNVVFCSSGLGRLHHLLSPTEQQRLLQTQSTAWVNVNLRAEDFTSDPQYLAFIHNDPLAGKQITERSRATLLTLEQLYCQEEITISLPAAYLSGMVDSVIDLPTAQNIFKRLTGTNGIMVQFPSHEHFLLFTKTRHALMSWLTHYVLTQGYQT